MFKVANKIMGMFVTLKTIMGKKGAKQTVEEGVTQPPIDVRRVARDALGLSSTDERCAHI